MRSPENDRLSISLSKKEKQLIRDAAKMDDRSVSSWIRTVLLDHARSKKLI